MAENKFKGVNMYDGTKKDFDENKLEDGYLNLVRTDADGNNGYIYMNGKSYGKSAAITNIDCGTY